jgi:phospholipase C
LTGGLPSRRKGLPWDRELAAIEHVVVLMLENRSFDHMLGFLYADTGTPSHLEQAKKEET